jgi:hypothetical protein
MTPVKEGNAMTMSLFFLALLVLCAFINTGITVNRAWRERH